MNTDQTVRIEAMQTLRDLAESPVLTVADIERMFDKEEN